MKPSIFDSIHIPKPCHEDWDKMTPDAKGAFCGSCQKSVHDFTNKSEEQVQQILEENKDQKICGRFSNEQLREEALPEVPVDTIPGHMPPLRAFALAIFLVFGALLFSNGAYAQKGKVKYVPRQEMLQGQVVAKPQPKPEPKPVCKPDPDIFMKGEIYIAPKPKPQLKDSVKAPIKPVKKDTIIPKEPIMGKVAYRPKPVPKDTIVKKAPTTENKRINPESNVAPATGSLSVLCYPNPANKETSIRYSVKNNTKATLELYDMSGKKVKTLMKDQSLYAGVYTTSFDISELHSGVYVCCFSSAEGVVTTRLSVVK